MAFRIESEGGEPRRFRLAGELDMATASLLTDALSAPAAEDGDLVLDLDELAFIDSSGIRSLLMVAEELGTHGRLILVGPSEPVDRTLRLVGIDRADNIEIRVGGS
jgi:anti-anti-sigma factor